MRWLPIVLLSLLGSVVTAQLPAPLERIAQAHGIPYEALSIVVRATDEDASVLAHLPNVTRNPASTI